jgi:hypothetical protein
MGWVLGPVEFASACQFKRWFRVSKVGYNRHSAWMIPLTEAPKGVVVLKVRIGDEGAQVEAGFRGLTVTE